MLPQLSAVDSQALETLYQLFPALSEEQKKQYQALGELYRYWNARINLISRKDIESLYLHHILHSLGICKVIRFKPSTIVADVGTGGGFPGIPLAILFPECHFILLDSTAKKIKVCQEIASSIGLKNVEAFHARVEDFSTSCHFVVSRAAMSLEILVKYTRHLFAKENFNALPNGIIALKGGDLTEELKPFRKLAEVELLDSFLHEEYFKEKKVIYLPIQPRRQ